MKKLLVLVFAAFALAAPRALAQDSQMFNHMALGATLGVDGVGLDAVFPMGANFQLRAGYAIDPLSLNLNLNLGQQTVGGKTVNLNGIPFSARSFNSGTGHLMADFYPSKKGGFHISAGLFVNNGKLLSATADLSNVLDRDTWGTASFSGISTDSKGTAYVDVKTWAAMPYVGIGFGRALTPDRLFGFVFDMGVLVWGSPQLQSRNYVRSTSDDVYDTTVITSESLGLNKDDANAKLLDAISSIPVCPYIRFGFYFRLF